MSHPGRALLFDEERAGAGDELQFKPSVLW